MIILKEFLKVTKDSIKRNTKEYIKENNYIKISLDKINKSTYIYFAINGKQKTLNFNRCIKYKELQEIVNT